MTWRSTRETVKPWVERWAVCLLLAAGPLCLHGALARERSRGLLAHDESITLLTTAGQASRIQEWSRQTHETLILPAAEVKDLMRLAPKSSTAAVLETLRRYDVHPPLYFVTVYWLQRCGLTSNGMLRLLGTACLLAAAWMADRWIWRWCPRWVRVLGFLAIMATPAMLEAATELRQYSFVYLGVVATLAGLNMLAEGEASLRRWPIMLWLALAWTGLAWTHYASAIWIALGFVLCLWVVPSEWRLGRRTVCWAAGLACVLILPLVLLAARNPRPGHWESMPMPSVSVQPAVRSVLAGAARAWWSVPWRWAGGGWQPIAAGLALAVSGWMAWRYGGRFDRAVWSGAVLWAVAWVILIMVGRVPLHATSPKHMAPLVLCPLFVLIRLTRETVPLRVRRGAGCLLVCILTSHAVGDYQLLAASGPPQWLPEVVHAGGLLVRAPKRGQLLPIAEKMRENATIVIAEPPIALRDWHQIEPALPEDSLLWMELDANWGKQRGAEARALARRLDAVYASRRTVAKGSSRIITEYSGRRGAATHSPGS